MNSSKIFFLDIDNTLLNKDLVRSQVKEALIKVLGKEETEQFWLSNNSFRKHEVFVEIPYIIKQHCANLHKANYTTTVKTIFDKMEFKNALYPSTTGLINHLKTFGKVNLFTEGDPDYQNAKITNSGLRDLVNKVFLYQHKLEYLYYLKLQTIEEKIYFIDDKASNLAEVKRVIPNAHTIRVLQGHYVIDESERTIPTDEQVNSIKELLTRNFD